MPRYDAKAAVEALELRVENLEALHSTTPIPPDPPPEPEPTGEFTTEFTHEFAGGT